MNAIDKTLSTDITLGHLLDAPGGRAGCTSRLPIRRRAGEGGISRYRSEGGAVLGPRLRCKSRSMVGDLRAALGYRRGPADAHARGEIRCHHPESIGPCPTGAIREAHVRSQRRRKADGAVLRGISAVDGRLVRGSPSCQTFELQAAGQMAGRRSGEGCVLRAIDKPRLLFLIVRSPITKRVGANPHRPFSPSSITKATLWTVRQVLGRIDVTAA